MLDKKNTKIALVYMLLQAVIWIKSAAYFSMFGHGKVLSSSRSLFPQEALFFDFLFHEFMHVAIGILALSFGKNFEKLEWLKLVGMIAIAVFFHNVGYWFTASHPNIAYSVIDFIRDTIILLAFVVAGFYLKKPLTKLESFARKHLSPRMKETTQ